MYLKNPRLGSKPVFSNSDKNSRDKPPPSIPASSIPAEFTNLTLNRSFKFGSDLLRNSSIQQLYYISCEKYEKLSLKRLNGEIDITLRLMAIIQYFTTRGACVTVSLF